MKKHVNPNAMKLRAALSLQGKVEVNRAWIIIEHVHRLTWEANPRNSNVEQYRIYEVQDSTRS